MDLCPGRGRRPVTRAGWHHVAELAAFGLPGRDGAAAHRPPRPPDGQRRRPRAVGSGRPGPRRRARRRPARASSSPPSSTSPSDWPRWAAAARPSPVPTPPSVSPTSWRPTPAVTADPHTDIDLDHAAAASTSSASAATGMQPIATVLAAMGHRVTGSDLKPSTGARPPAGPGRRGPGRPCAANLPIDLDLVAVSTAIPAANPEVVAARGAGRTGGPPGDPAGRHRRAPAGPSPCRDPRQDHHLVDARRWCWRRPAWRRRSSSAATSPSSARGRPGTTATGSWSRPTRATAPSPCSPGGGDRHQHRARPPRVPRVGRGPPRRLRPLPRGDARAHGGLCRRCRRRRPGARPSAPSPTAPRPTPTSASSTSQGHRVGARFSVRQRRERLGEVDLPIPGAHNARNATAALAMGSSWACASTRRRPPSAASPGWPAASSSAARPPASPSSTTTPTCRPRWRPLLARGPRRWLAPGRRRLPTAPLQPHRGALARVRRLPSSGRTCWSSPTSTPPARPPGPASPASSWSTPCLAAHPAASRWPTCPHRRRSGGVPAAPSCGPATSASPSAPATSPPCPTTCWPVSRAGGVRLVSAPPHWTRTSRRRRGRRGRCRRDRRVVGPVGPLTTYRLGGPAALLVRADDDGRTSPRWAGPVAGTALPALVVGRGSNLLVADAGFAGVAVVHGRRASASRHRGHRCRAPAGPPACRSWPAAPPPPA